MSQSRLVVPSVPRAVSLSREHTDAPARDIVYTEDHSQVGTTSQMNYFHHDHLPVGERIADWGKYYNACRRRKRYVEILEKTGGTKAERLQAAKDVADRYISRPKG